jgi:hypothetical protein
MRALGGVVGLVSALSLACGAGGPAPLRLSKEPFLDTGLHRVERPGRGELLVSPDLERVRAQIRESNGAILRCQVSVDKKHDSPALAPAKQVLERELCASVEHNITTRPRPSVGPGSEAPARLVSSPGPGVMLVEAWLINVEGDATRLEPTPKTMFSLRLFESLGGKPVMRYYEEARSAANGPLDAMIDASMGRLYELYEDVLNSGPTDVAAPPR